MKKFLNIFTIFLIFLNVYLFASSDLSVKIELCGLEEKATVYLGETFKVKVIVNGGDRDTSDVNVVDLDKLNVEGTSRSTSISMINGDFKSETVYFYDVSADQEGIFNIGPAQVKGKGGNAVNSNVLNFNVIKREGGRVVSNKKNVKKDLNFSNIPSKAGEYELFCKLKTDKDIVVVGEPLLLSINVYSRGNILQMGMDTVKFQDFLSKEIPKVAKRREEVDGKLYNVLEKKYVLLPTESGDKQINPVGINFHIPIIRKNIRSNFLDDDFFSGFLGSRVETKRAISDDLKIKVNALPLYKGDGDIDGVGSFNRFYVTVDKKDVIMNEPILLSIEIDGQGNLDQIVSPKLNLPEFFNSYESKIDFKEDLSGNHVGGKKRFEYVLQIGRYGEFYIPEQKFTYFDIEDRNYKTLKSEAIKLNIRKPPEGLGISYNQSDIENKKTIEKEGENYKQDISFIEEDVDEIFKREEKSIPIWFFLILLGFPFLFYSIRIFDSIYVKFHNKFFKKYEKQKSLSKFKKNLDNIIKKQDVFQIYSFFLNYLATKFNVNLNVVNEDWIEIKLNNSGWSIDKIHDFLSCLSEYASLSFAFDEKKDFNYGKLLDKARYWFLMLESIR